MENKCIFCGKIIPEGIQVCPKCWEEMMQGDSNEDN